LAEFPKNCLVGGILRLLKIIRVSGLKLRITQLKLIEKITGAVKIIRVSGLKRS
jgi:hypothetical protein